MIDIVSNANKQKYEVRIKIENIYTLYNRDSPVIWFSLLSRKSTRQQIM